MPRRNHFRYPSSNSDARDPLPSAGGSGTKPDTKSEARGDTRKAIGNTARDTDADPTGPEGNDNQRGRDDDDRDFPHSRR